jgi:hypothetical protein
LKDLTPAELVKAIKSAPRGESLMHPSS